MDDWASLAETIGAEPVVGSLLREQYELGRARWPKVATLSPADFATHVAMHLPPDVDRTEHLAALDGEDLYLACACVHELPGAVVAFDAQFLSRVPSFVAHIDRTPAFAD